MATYLIGEIDMITCKEDLIGTEFKITCKEEANLLKSKCELFGIEHATWSCCNYSDGVMRGIIGKDLDTYHSCKLLFTSREEGACSMPEFRSLRFVDIKELSKPKPTKFVKVEESIFDLKEEFDSGELYFRWLGNGEQGSGGVGYDQIDDINMLLVRWEEKRVYRQVEIDWRSELREALELTSHRPLGTGSVRVGDSDLTDDEFISLCHKVAELTDKPE
jgi:hypothetical protein